MCDPGYYGIDCSIEDTNHYLMDTMRNTWDPYALFFIVCIAYAVVLPFTGIHKGACQNYEGCCRLYQSLVEYALNRVTSMINFVHSVMNPCLILIIFADLLAYIYYLDTWKTLTIKIAISVALLLGSSVWQRLLKKYNHVVKPQTSFWLMMFDILVEIAYVLANMLLVFKITQTHKVISFSYFYQFWQLMNLIVVLVISTEGRMIMLLASSGEI